MAMEFRRVAQVIIISLQNTLLQSYGFPQSLLAISCRFHIFLVVACRVLAYITSRSLFGSHRRASTYLTAPFHSEREVMSWKIVFHYVLFACFSHWLLGGPGRDNARPRR